MGIDPGLARMGYASLKMEPPKITLLQCGLLTSSRDESTPRRLCSLYEGLTRVFEQMMPDEVAIEELFFEQNVKTAMEVSQARGVALLVCGLFQKPVYEYKPVHVKQAVTGFGRATKDQIQKMIRILLNLTKAPQPDDVADAVALAWTHIQMDKWQRERPDLGRNRMAIDVSLKPDRSVRIYRGEKA